MKGRDASRIEIGRESNILGSRRSYKNVVNASVIMEPANVASLARESAMCYDPSW